MMLGSARTLIAGLISGLIVASLSAQVLPDAPTTEAAPAGLVVRRVAPVTVDGRNWRDAEPFFGPRVVRSTHLSVVLDRANDLGDVERFRLSVRRNDGTSVVIAQTVSYAWLSPDARWLIYEPLDVVDLVAWKRYSLASIAGVTPYVVPRAVSRDGRRVIVRHSDCAVDCLGQPIQDFEITLPGR